MALLDNVPGWEDIAGVGRNTKIDYIAPEKDATQKEFEKAQYDRAINPPDIKAGYESAIQHGKGMLGTQNQQGLWASALQEKANQRFNSMADSLRRRAQYDQSINNNKILGAALKTSFAQRELDRSIQMRQAEAEAQYQAARASAISSILGTAGMVGGFALGGMGGGLAGAQAGKMAPPQPNQQASMGIDPTGSQTGGYNSQSSDFYRRA